jgi:uroporphyrinogen-III synthase
MNPLRLQGKRILITRARQQAEALARLFTVEGAEVISIPTIEIVPPQSFQPLDKALHKIQAYDWLILTSINGVDALHRRMEKADIDPGLLRRLRIVAIGPATRAALEAIGLSVDVMPDEYIAESVVAALRERVNGKRVLLVRAKLARDVIPKQLQAAGAVVDVAEAYQTVLPQNSKAKLQALLAADERPHVITFTSSSTVRNFLALFDPGQSPKQLLRGIRLASIGPVTSTTLRETGLWVDIEASGYTMPGLVEAVARDPQLSRNTPDQDG